MSTCRRSATWKPAMLSSMVMEKNAMPKDIAKRGVTTGANTGDSLPFRRSSQLSPFGAWAARDSGTWPMVCARMLCTRLRGGSISSSPFSQCMPMLASSTMVRHAEQESRCASKAARVEPCKVPSMASASRASTSTHCIPGWFSLAIVLSGSPNKRRFCACWGGSTYLPVVTLEEPCKFRSSPIYATFHSSLGHFEYYGNILVVHVLQIPQDNRLPQLRRKLRQGLVDHLLCLLALHPRLGSGGRIFQLLGQRQAFLLVSGRSVQRVSYSVVLSFTEVIHQQIARHRGYPGHEGGPRGVIRAQGAIHFDEHFLGQVSRVLCRAGKAVADVVDTPMVLLDDVLPSRSVASHTATDKGIDGLDVVQSALPRHVTPGPNPIHCWSFIRGREPEVRLRRTSSREFDAACSPPQFACIVAGRRPAFWAVTGKRIRLATISCLRLVVNARVRLLRFFGTPVKRVPILTAGHSSS